MHWGAGGDTRKEGSAWKYTSVNVAGNAPALLVADAVSVLVGIALAHSLASIGAIHSHTKRS